jgi:hypothetical protein
MGTAGGRQDGDIRGLLCPDVYGAGGRQEGDIRGLSYSVVYGYSRGRQDGDIRALLYPDVYGYSRGGARMNFLVTTTGDLRGQLIKVFKLVKTVTPTKFSHF